MATFKHISSKNADYGAAEQYLTFEHDEFTMKPTLDEAGRLILREDYRIATLNCGEEDFAVACMRANLRYGKNQKREDVKSHHYIISFDPRDAADNGLTVDRAQALGEEFCAEHFPGHQAIVCTHPDGHNHSGNIHVHIVINSLRIEEVPFLPYMDRPADTRTGCKHRCTDAAMEYFKAEVMELCHRENLYQIDLLHGSKNRITEREYWAQRKGQAMYLSHDAAKGVIETYGMERVSMVLSNTVQLQDWDGRYSRRNKEWAKTIPNENPETVRCGYVLNSHPAVLDGFIDLVREEQQRSRTQGEKLQPSRPSVRDKLKQELPAHKPAAPKKREPER